MNFSGNSDREMEFGSLDGRKGGENNGVGFAEALVPSVRSPFALEQIHLAEFSLNTTVPLGR